MAMLWLLGCQKGASKHGLKNHRADRPSLLHRAVHLHRLSYMHALPFVRRDLMGAMLNFALRWTIKRLWKMECCLTVVITRPAQSKTPPCAHLCWGFPECSRLKLSRSRPEA